MKMGAKVVELEDFISLGEAARRLGVHRTLFYYYFEKGMLRPFRVGGHLVVLASEVESLKKKASL